MNAALTLVVVVPLALAARIVQETPANSLPQQRVDPTSIDAELLRVLAERPTSGAAATPTSVAPFPAVAIRGLVVPQSGAALAILDVDGARVRVRAGSVVPFGGGDHLRVEEIGAGEVLLLRESTGEERAVR